ncbi:MAG: S-layer homology domain-containing protein [Clostridia bacterium]|nr:S-layer homology domain-containing protein [Clostridia bacterium]
MKKWAKILTVTLCIVLCLAFAVAAASVSVVINALNITGSTNGTTLTLSPTKAQLLELNEKLGGIDLSKIPQGMTSLVLNVSKDFFGVETEVTKADLKALYAGQTTVMTAKFDKLTADFTVVNKVLAYNDYRHPIAFSFDITVSDDRNPAYLVAYTYDGDGNRVLLPRSNYEDGTIHFYATRLGTFGIQYNPVTFNDVPEKQWYYSAISYMAARGIIGGMGNGNFEPTSNIKRGDFLIMLMRSFGIPLEENLTDNFPDAGNKYYTAYLGTAKKLGLVGGFPDGTYRPEAEITRQDMFLMLYNILTSLELLPEKANNKTVADFSDGDKVQSYAKNAFNALIQSGVVAGSNGQLLPRDNAQRSHAAQILYGVLK